MLTQIRGLGRSLLIAAGAFIVYSGWAVYANWEYGFHKCFVASLTQGTISFLSTAFMTMGMEEVFHRMDTGVLRFITTALGPQTMVAIITATSHYVVGTPEILVTMAPSLIIGTTFCILYTARMQVGYHQRAQGGPARVP
jgi:hypothetical protein